jgi:hypothetical protein
MTPATLTPHRRDIAVVAPVTNPRQPRDAQSSRGICFAPPINFSSTLFTGRSVDHSYIWVKLNGQKVLAIDPVCVYNIR